MKTWTTPETIQVRNLVRPEAPTTALPFRQWALECVLNDSRMGHTPVLLARLMRLITVCESEPGTQVTVEDEDWNRMVAVINEPNDALHYAPMADVQLAPYRDAILNAKAPTE